MLLSPIEHDELIPQLALCAVTAAGILLVLAVVIGLLLLGRSLFESSRRWRSRKP
jgi:hypothetical protein